MKQYFQKHIKLKLLLMFGFSLVVSLLLSLILHSLFFQEYYLEHYEENMLLLFQQIESELDSENLPELIEELNYQEQVTIMIADENLRYSLTARGQNRVIEERLSQEYHIIIEKEDEILAESHLCFPLEHSDGRPELLFIKTLSNGKYCIFTHPWEHLEKNMEAITEFHVIVAVIACFVGILSTYSFAKGFTKPILEMNIVTESMSRLDFQKKITYTSPDEMGQLAESINTLSRKLEEHRSALKNEIAFQKVLSQNMSHELKTPISVMQAYLEGLSMGLADDKETREEYISISLNECKRMTNLIDRMLNLSKLTSFQEDGLEKEEFSSRDLVSQLQSQSNALFTQHSMVLEEEILCENLWGNEELLLQCLGNFVSNAVKYGDNTKLKITVSEVAEHYILSVYNSGNPVAEEEKEKIFDVFYMVDKVRGREANSHGLGLSVCKTITELHHGRVFCEIVEGDDSLPDGMVFSCQIPKQ
ncbi:MAG: HAMP domain-containing sensor histidine kinase [Eubacteriales bacterium]